MPRHIRLILHPDQPPSSKTDYASRYLCSGEVSPPAGIEMAIACLFGPLGTAVTSGSRVEVEQAIAISRTQFETYMNLALIRCPLRSISDPSVQPVSNANGGHQLPRVSPVKPNGHRESEFDPDENLDLDNEVL